MKTNRILALSSFPFLLSIGCSDPNESPAPECGGPTLTRPLLVLEGDESVAAGTGLAGTDGCLKESPNQLFGSDPTLSDVHGRPFVCTRPEGTCYEVNRATMATSPAGTYSTYQSEGEPPTNPHDLDADAAGQLWIARYNLATVAIIRPDGTFRGTVDLGSFDPDGIPDMEALRIVGDRAYVSLELLEKDYKATGPGRVAIIDLEALSVVGSIPLVGENPFGHMTAVISDATGSTFAVATPGDLFAADCKGCGVELLDVVKGTSTQVLSETDLGGSVVEALIVDPKSEGYAIVAGTDSNNPTWVVAFDPSTQKVTRILADTRPLSGDARGYYDSGLAIDGDYVLFGDRTKSKPGLHIVRRADGKETTAELPVQIYPPIGLMTL